jgi:hypothetical protein
MLELNATCEVAVPRFCQRLETAPQELVRVEKNYLNNHKAVFNTMD